MSDVPVSNRTVDRTGDATRSCVRERRRRPRPHLGNFPFAEKASLISPIVVTGMVRLIDFLIVTCIGYAIAAIYIGPDEFPGYAGYLLYGIAVLMAGAVASVSFHAVHLYNIAMFAKAAGQIARIGIAWTGVFAFLMAIAFFLKLGAEYSRVWLMAWYLSGLFALIVFRLGVRAVVRAWGQSGRLNRRAVIVGGGPAAEELIRAFESSPDTDIRIYGIFDDRGPERVSPVVAGYPKLGNIDELVRFGREKRVDLLIVSLPITAEKRVLQLLQKLCVLPVDIRLSAHTSKLRFRPRTYSYIGNVPFIDVADKPIADWDYVLKWLFDKTVGALCLAAAAPIMVLVALAIKLESRGPVLFRQKRYGFNNELVEVFKFRSMYADQTDRQASRLVTKDDPRVTRVGRFIRKTSLDELPQLFNVLRGDLSLVGPRPHAVKAKAADAFYDHVVDGYFARHRVKPGITGWAQINGWRGETDTAEKLQRRVEHDLFYIENWSVWFDTYILCRTPFALFNTRNAY